jgi:steroid delta-isomerase
MLHHRVVVFVVGLVLATAPAHASDEAARAEIASALAQWTEDFNAGRADKVCDLFARDLRADFRGVPERGYEAQCDLLQRALSDPARRFSYALSIKDIQVWGDTAVVRLDWTLTVRPRDAGRGGAAGGAGESVTREPGLDVFRRERDGRWRIVRYMAYEG